MVSASLRVGSEAISESKFGRNESGAHHVVGAGELGDRVSQYAGPELAHGVIGAEQVGRPRAGAHTAEHLTAHRKMKVPSLRRRLEKMFAQKSLLFPRKQRATHQRFTLASWSAAASSASTPSSPLSAPPSPSFFAAFFRKSLKHFLSCAQNLSTSASVVPSAAAAVK